MAVFSSTQNTAACCGGFKYSPMMSAALASNSGSWLAIYRSSRCGCSLACARIRCTVDLLTPNSSANRRHDQCVLVGRHKYVGEKQVTLQRDSENNLDSWQHSFCLCFGIFDCSGAGPRPLFSKTWLFAGNSSCSKGRLGGPG